MRIQFDVPDNASPDFVAVRARQEWVAFHQAPGESLLNLSRRLGFTYRTIRYLAQGRHGDKPITGDCDPHGVQPEGEQCMFCKSTERLHEHHIINRKESSQTVTLCEACHRVFHLLNKLYRLPPRPKSS